MQLSTAFRACCTVKLVFHHIPKGYHVEHLSFVTCCVILLEAEESTLRQYRGGDSQQQYSGCGISTMLSWYSSFSFSSSLQWLSQRIICLSLIPSTLSPYPQHLPLSHKEVYSIVPIHGAKWGGLCQEASSIKSWPNKYADHQHKWPKVCQGNVPHTLPPSEA